MKIRDGETDALKKEILELALAHRLVSPYTSFIAVEQEPARPDAATLKKRNVPNARPAGQTPQTYAFPQTATASIEQLWSGLACLLAGLVLWLWPYRNRVRVVA